MLKFTTRTDYGSKRVLFLQPTEIAGIEESSEGWSVIILNSGVQRPVVGDPTEIERLLHEYWTSHSI